MAINKDPIQFDGLDKILKQFAEIGAPDKAIKAANQNVGKLVVGKAKALVPVKTGNLLTTLRAAALKNRVVVRGGNNSSVPYANPIHWGWFYDKNSFIYKNIMPQPFLAEALDYNREKIYNKYADEMQKLIDQYTPPKPKG
jgi:HK97 gp10 family phage protein